MSNAHFCKIFFVVLLFAVVSPAWANDAPILAADADYAPAPGEIRPFPQLVNLVLKATDKRDLAYLDGCIADQGLRQGDFASLLRAVPIKVGTDHRLWFVRPAPEHYCVFDGANSFRYFLIDEQLSATPTDFRLLFANSGSNFFIYSQQSHGLNDIESDACITTGCEREKMSFDGRKYRPVLCTSWTWKPGALPQSIMPGITKVHRCKPDNWVVNGATGLVDLSGN